VHLLPLPVHLTLLLLPRHQSLPLIGILCWRLLWTMERLSWCLRSLFLPLTFMNLSKSECLKLFVTECRSHWNHLSYSLQLTYGVIT
jgi:hypothetical protein